MSKLPNKTDEFVYTMCISTLLLLSTTDNALLRYYWGMYQGHLGYSVIKSSDSAEEFKCSLSSVGSYLGVILRCGSFGDCSCFSFFQYFNELQLYQIK